MAFRDHEPIEPSVIHGNVKAELRQISNPWGFTAKDYQNHLQKIADWAGGTLTGTSSPQLKLWRIEIEDNDGNIQIAEPGSWIAITTDDDLLITASYREAYHKVSSLGAERAGRIIPAADFADLLAALRVEMSTGRLGEAAKPLQKIRNALGLNPTMTQEQVHAAIKSAEIK